MPFKKKIRGKESTYYYVDFWVGDVHVNKSTRCRDYNLALKVEESYRREAEELYFERQEIMQEDLTLQQAIDYTYKERWSRTETGDRSVVQAERLAEMLSVDKLSQLSGKRGMLLIQGVRDKLLKEVGPTTVDRHLTALKTVLKQVGDDLEPEGFVLPKIKLFNKQNRRERVLSKDEERDLFRVMSRKHFEYAELFTVMLETGMRLGEALNIRYDTHILLTERIIRLDSSMTKNGKPRTIPLNERALRILHNCRKGDTDRAFPFVSGTCNRIFRETRAKIGLADDEHFVPHMLRHTITTRMLSGGARKWKVQAILGHSDAKMTSWYHHYGHDELRDAVELLDNVRG